MKRVDPRGDVYDSMVRRNNVMQFPLAELPSAFVIMPVAQLATGVDLVAQVQWRKLL